MTNNVILISSDLSELKTFETQLHQKIEGLSKQLNSIKSQPKYTKRDRSTMSKLQQRIESNNLLLNQSKLMAQFQINTWVRLKKTIDNKPGLIESLRIVNKTLEIQVKWFKASVSIPESPINLETVSPELMDYVWDGENPKLIRKLDSYECADLKVLNQELAEAEDKKIKVYLKKRIKQLSTHSNKQLEALVKFSQRKPQVETIAIDLISQDSSTQQRISRNQETVAEYAEAMADGADFPPIKVISEGDKYWLYDGYHTLEAALINKATEIKALIEPGTLREAILKSVGVNSEHGLRRSDKDKRKAVTTLLTDSEWSQWSNCEVARKARVSESLVRKVKKELGTSAPFV